MQEKDVSSYPSTYQTVCQRNYFHQREETSDWIEGELPLPVHIERIPMT